MICRKCGAEIKQRQLCELPTMPVWCVKCLKSEFFGPHSFVREISMRVESVVIADNTLRMQPIPAARDWWPAQRMLYLNGSHPGTYVPKKEDMLMFDYEGVYRMATGRMIGNWNESKTAIILMQCV